MNDRTSDGTTSQPAGRTAGRRSRPVGRHGGGRGDRRGGGRGDQRRPETGSATVLTLPLVAVLALLSVVLAAASGALVALRRAEAAADLAALAGAVAATQGRDPCAAAATVAVRNGAGLESCRAGPRGQVRVVATVPATGPWPRRFDIEGTARAGPAAGP